MTQEPNLVRAGALYRQVADRIRDAITRGEYPPGSILPSESAFIEKYEVSRPTVRQALAALRAEGLIQVRHGKGSYVRDTNTAHTLTRTAADPWAQLTPTGKPERHRQEADPRTAALLDVEEGHALFIQDQAATHTETGRRVLTRRILPLATAEQADLGADTFPDRAALITQLEKLHGPLTADEYVRVTAPRPDEAAHLGLTEGTPILETTRITSTPDRHPLIAETERNSAEAIQYAYRLTNA